MSPRTDLDHLITGLKSGAIEPFELARLAREWQSCDGPFLAFVAARNGTVAFAPDQSQVPTPPDEFRTGGPVSTLDLPGGRPAPVPPPADSRGGRYGITAAHRAGGLGAVWRAWDPVLGREVAVKTVRPDRRPTENQLARFVREARVTGRLEHPCVVPVYDLVETDPAGPCYVMRFVSGRTLAEAAAEYHRGRERGTAGPLDLAGLLDAFAAVCRAVAFAHAKGVLHRDLKGQNVVLGEFGEVFLVDWGLAKETADASPAGPGGGPDAAEDTGPETAHGSLVGTPSFMAPEVARGEPAGRPSDVYGLGAMLYQLLTGRPPYDGPDPRAVANAVAAGEPPAVRAVNPAAPPPLAAVCAKAMGRDPTARYPTADALALDVKRWLAGEPVSAYPEPLQVRVGRWANRNKSWVATGLAVLLTAVAGLSLSTALLAEEQRKTAAARDQAAAEKAAAETQRNRAEANLDAAHQLTVGLIQVTEKVLPAVAQFDRPRRSLTRHAAHTLREFASQRSGDAALARSAARATVTEANLLRLTGEADAADTAYRQSLAALRRDPADLAGLAAALRDRAALLARTGRLTDADRELADAQLAVGRVAAGSVRDRLSATVWLGRASVDAQRGRWAEASAAADAALADLERLPSGDPNPDAHPYDPLLRAFALINKGVAGRGTGGAAAADKPLADAATLLNRLEKERQPGVQSDDIRFALVCCVYEQAETVRQTGAAAGPALEQNLDAAVRVLDNLCQRHDAVPMYQYWAGRARVVRAELRAANGRTADAVADLTAAADRLRPLGGRHPGFPEYRAEYGRSVVALARLTADPETADRLRADGRAALAAAAAAAVGDAEIAGWAAAARR